MTLLEKAKGFATAAPDIHQRTFAGLVAIN